MRPLRALAAEGYPDDKVRIVLLPDGRVHAYPATAVIAGTSTETRCPAAICAFNTTVMTPPYSGCQSTGLRRSSRSFTNI